MNFLRKCLAALIALPGLMALLASIHAISSGQDAGWSLLVVSLVLLGISLWIFKLKLPVKALDARAIASAEKAYDIGRGIAGILRRKSTPVVKEQPPSTERIALSPERIDLYQRLTDARDWTGVCKLNNVPFDNFLTKKELVCLPDHLEPNEAVLALTSGLMKQTTNSNLSDIGINSSLLALTTKRILILDAALLTKSIDVQSIRLDRINAISSSQGFLLGKITIDLGARLVVVDNCFKGTTPPFVYLANQLLDKKASSSNKQVSTDAPVSTQLAEYHKLHMDGIISDEEFAAIKSKIIAKI